MANLSKIKYLFTISEIIFCNFSNIPKLYTSIFSSSKSFFFYRFNFNNDRRCGRIYNRIYLLFCSRYKFYKCIGSIFASIKYLCIFIFINKGFIIIFCRYIIFYLIPIIVIFIFSIAVFYRNDYSSSTLLFFRCTISLSLLILQYFLCWHSR
jgi:hypothetical protein